MHILVTNDDGPPSQQSSPYVHSLVKTLQGAGHTVSVILPHVQRSWIGKAHFVGQVTKPTYFRPGTLHTDDGTVHERPLPDDAAGEEWVLVDGTPGTCAQLGLYHFFQDREPIDLVVSGPNYGRNSTALFSLSSGTIGGAMEAATCKKKAVALSYAFYSRDHDPTLIAGASRLSARVIQHLFDNWDSSVDLYSVNVPLVEGVEDHKIMYTNVLQNYWKSGSPFQEIEPEEKVGESPEEQEKEIRHQQIQPTRAPAQAGQSRHKHRHFKWAPKFTDVAKSVEESPVGNDGWALGEGYTSVTPLKANFMHVSSTLNGELKLSSAAISIIPTTPILISPLAQPRINAVIAYEDPYVQPLILSALHRYFPSVEHTTLPTTFSSDECPFSHVSCPTLYVLPYESLPFDLVHSHPSTAFCNAYIIRKALIRKHYLANTLTTYLTKNPGSPLAKHVPVTVSFELDYAEFLDEALAEAYELQESFAKNEEKTAGDQEREWWILKPSMSDRGQGIRLFSSEEELQTIFEEWEIDNPDDEEDDEDDEEAGDTVRPGLSEPAATKTQSDGTGIITSQLRHFVAQTYIPPLLFPELGNRKFHIRSYVLAVGALKVYVYREMLALFASGTYRQPGKGSESVAGAARSTKEKLDMRPHLTNTCLQDGTREGSVIKFWDLPSPSPFPSTTVDSSADSISGSKDWRQTIYDAISVATGALFAAAASQPTTFQPLPNAFELFGVDWMVGEKGQVYLLEVNAFPDFQQTGEELKGVVQGVWDGVFEKAVRPFFGLDQDSAEEKDRVGRGEMTLVLDLDMGRV